MRRGTEACAPVDLQYLNLTEFSSNDKRPQLVMLLGS
jgi:hypothetical protein